MSMFSSTSYNFPSNLSTSFGLPSNQTVDTESRESSVHRETLGERSSNQRVATEGAESNWEGRKIGKPAKKNFICATISWIFSSIKSLIIGFVNLFRSSKDHKTPKTPQQSQEESQTSATTEEPSFIEDESSNNEERFRIEVPSYNNSKHIPYTAKQESDLSDTITGRGNFGSPQKTLSPPSSPKKESNNISSRTGTLTHFDLSGYTIPENSYQSPPQSPQKPSEESPQGPSKATTPTSYVSRGIPVTPSSSYMPSRLENMFTPPNSTANSSSYTSPNPDLFKAGFFDREELERSLAASQSTTPHTPPASNEDLTSGGFFNRQDRLKALAALQPATTATSSASTATSPTSTPLSDSFNFGAGTLSKATSGLAELAKSGQRKLTDLASDKLDLRHRSQNTIKKRPPSRRPKISIALTGDDLTDEKIRERRLGKDLSSSMISFPTQPPVSPEPMSQSLILPSRKEENVSNPSDGTGSLEGSLTLEGFVDLGAPPPVATPPKAISRARGKIAGMGLNINPTALLPGAVPVIRRSPQKQEENQ